MKPSMMVNQRFDTRLQFPVHDKVLNFVQFAQDFSMLCYLHFNICLYLTMGETSVLIIELVCETLLVNTAAPHEVVD